MFEDKILVSKCKCGDSSALCRIYEKYKDYLLSLAAALLHEKTYAEDILHDTFVSFAESIDVFQLKGSLKAYLAVCVRNQAIDKNRKDKRQTEILSQTEAIVAPPKSSADKIIETEEIVSLRNALDQLPYEQREVVVLYHTAKLKFRQIAKLQDVSIGTVHGRYRYGLEKLRILLSGRRINEIRI